MHYYLRYNYSFNITKIIIKNLLSWKIINDNKQWWAILTFGSNVRNISPIQRPHIILRKMQKCVEIHQNTNPSKPRCWTGQLQAGHSRSKNSWSSLSVTECGRFPTNSCWLSGKLERRLLASSLGLGVHFLSASLIVSSWRAGLKIHVRIRKNSQTATLHPSKNIGTACASDRVLCWHHTLYQWLFYNYYYQLFSRHCWQNDNFCFWKQWDRE